MTNQQIQQIRKIAAAVVETVQETGGGPESSIYLALQSSLGLTHAQCVGLVSAMVDGGLLRRDNHWLTAV